MHSSGDTTENLGGVPANMRAGGCTI